jgi:hypothetical protein
MDLLRTIPRFKFIRADLEDAAPPVTICCEEKFEVAINLAAQMWPPLFLDQFAVRSLM